MKKPDVFRLAYDALREPLAAHGFKLFKGRQSFRRETSFGWQEIGFTVAHYHPVYRLRFSLLIRFDELVEIYLEIYGYEEIAPRSRAATTTSFGNFLGDRNYSYEVAEPGAVGAACGEFLQLMDGHGFPFFERYSRLEAVEENLNNGLEEVSILCFTYPERAKIGAIAAWLVNREELEAVLARHAARLDGFGNMPPGRRGFDDCAAFLRSKL